MLPECKELLLSLDGGARAATAALTETTQRTGGGQ